MLIDTYMYILQKSTYTYLSHLLTSIFGLFILLGAMSCNCQDNPVKDGSKDATLPNESLGKLTIAVQPSILVGGNKFAEIILSLESSDKALLEDFSLKASYVDGEGELAYKKYAVDGTYTPNKVVNIVNEKLTHLSPSKELKPGEEPIKILFTLVPDKACTTATVKFELLNKDGVLIKDVPLTWKNVEEAIKLELTPSGDKAIKGGVTSVDLTITNKGTQATEAGKLKLRIKRIAGTKAIIDEATPIDAENYEIDLNIIDSQKNLVKNITILPSEDKQAKFSCQLVYDGHDVAGSSVGISWEKGISVILKDIQYHKDTRHITYTVENNGSEPIKNLQLSYKNKVGDIKLGGEDLISLDTEKIVNIIDNLVPEQKLEHQNLGELDFGPHKEAKLAFNLIYDGGSTDAETHIFTAEDINLGLSINYDKIKAEVTYVISNQGNAEAADVQLEYNNESILLGPKTVKLDGQTSTPTAAVTLAPKIGQTTGTISIDFNTQDSVMVRFSILYKGVVIKQQLEQFDAPKVDLELKLESSPQLWGEEREIKLRIVPKPGSRPLEKMDINKLVLSGFGSDKLFSRKPDGTDKIDNIIKFDKVDAIKNTVLLYLDVNELNNLHPKGVNFEFLLKYGSEYKRELQGTPVKVTWKRVSDLEIISNDEAFIDTGLFQLSYPGFDEVDIRNLTVELMPEEGSNASFVLLDYAGGPINTSAPFSQLTGKTTLQRTSGWARLKLVDSHGEKRGKVEVLLKRNGNLINLHTLSWREPEYKIAFDADTETFDDKNGCEIDLTNQRDVIDTNQINVQLTADNKTSFQLGKITGTSINTSLTDIWGGKNTSFDQRRRSFTLRRDTTTAIPNVYQIPIRLIFKSLAGRGKNFSIQEELMWINTVKVKKEIEEALEVPIKGAQKDFEKFKNLSTTPNSEQIKIIYQARKQALGLKQKAEKKLQDEKSILSNDLEKRIREGAIQPAEKLVMDIDAYTAKFLSSARQDIERLVKVNSEAMIEQELEKIPGAHSLKDLNDLMKKIEGHFIANNQRYIEAEAWVKFISSYKLAANGAGITQLEAVKEIEDLWAKLQANLQVSYEKAAEVYALLFKNTTNGVTRDNIDANFADNVVEIFQSFYRFMGMYPTSQMTPTASSKIAQTFQHVATVLLYAVEASKFALLKDTEKASYATKVEEYINSDLFKNLEKYIGDKKQPTALTESLKATLRMAKTAVEYKKSIHGSDSQAIQECVEEIDKRLVQY